MSVPVIDARGVVRSYRMGGEEVQALRGVDLEVQRGEHVAIMGPSGSGKSTLMNILGCLDTPTSGSYRLDGVDVAGLKADDLATVRNRKVGFVFQTFNLLPRFTALANVELPLSYAGVAPADRRRRAEEVLAEVGLKERMHHRPSELSGGQRQRVAVARALAVRPALLLADEPTGNLDSRVGEEILQLFESLNRDAGVTLVVITHDEKVARRASRQVLILDGRIVRDTRSGPLSE